MLVIRINSDRPLRPPPSPLSATILSRPLAARPPRPANPAQPPPLGLGPPCPPCPLCPLCDLPAGQPAIVESLSAPADLPEWSAWLAEIGFLPGERVQVVRRGPIGGDPLVVRIGDSTFALHRAEAACVTVRPDLPSASPGSGASAPS